MERAYEYRQYDRVWQRVAPSLEPYPGGTACGDGTGAAAPAAGRRPFPPGADVRTVTGEPVPTAPAARTAVPAAAQAAALPTPSLPSMPGAESNPCCMGSEAAEDLEVLAGFIEAEREEERSLLALGRQAPRQARPVLRGMVSGAAARARRLSAAYYLAAGTCYAPMPDPAAGCPARWREALRARYHSAACMALNYARAADGTSDPCLAALFRELSADAFRLAGGLMRLLERAVQPGSER